MNGTERSDRPILVFDSGIGGLSVLKEIQRCLPEHRIDYLADDAGFPYGERDAGDLVRRVVDLLAVGIDRLDPELVVIACNTASTLVLPPLRARFSLPFVGTVPAVKPAAEQSRSGHVSVLATPATIARDYTRDLICQFAAHCHIRLVGAPDLAALAEAFLRGEAISDADILRQIAPCFVTEPTGRTDHIVLACTHFPFLVSRFKALAPWPVTWLDPAPAIARRVANLATADRSKPADSQAEMHTVGRAYFTGSDTSSSAVATLMRRFGLSVAGMPVFADGGILPVED